MTDAFKAAEAEKVFHVEEGKYGTQAVPDYLKVEGGVVLDTGARNEHHLKVARDGHVGNHHHSFPKSKSIVKTFPADRVV